MLEIPGCQDRAGNDIVAPHSAVRDPRTQSKVAAASINPARRILATVTRTFSCGVTEVGHASAMDLMVQVRCPVENTHVHILLDKEKDVRT
jgi:hypothetical protein